MCAKKDREDIRTGGNFDEVKEFAEYRRTRSITLRNRIVEQYIPAVYYFVHKYRANDKRFQDIVDFFKARLVTHYVDRFDHTKGFKFNTFLGNCIRYGLTTLQHHWNMHGSSKRREVNVMEDVVKKFEGYTLLTQHFEPPSFDPVVCDEFESLSPKLAVALSSLKSREKRVIYYRYIERVPLRDLVPVFGITSERIRQIEKLSIKKIRSSLKAQGVSCDS